MHNQNWLIFESVLGGEGGVGSSEIIDVHIYKWAAYIDGIWFYILLQKQKHVMYFSIEWKKKTSNCKEKKNYFKQNKTNYWIIEVVIIKYVMV